MSNLEAIYKQYEDTVMSEIIHNDNILMSKRDIEKIRKILDKIAKKHNKLTKLIKENTVNNKEKDLDNSSKNNTTADSTAVRDKTITNTKKAKIRKKDKLVDNVVLDEIKIEYAIENQPGKLPVKCRCLTANCIFTPQKTVIIEKGSKLAAEFVVNTDKLSKLTKLNIARAFKRKELKGVMVGDKKMYEVLGDITCSSRLDASRLISGCENIKHVHFYVGNMLLNDYLNTGKTK